MSVWVALAGCAPSPPAADAGPGLDEDAADAGPDCGVDVIVARDDLTPTRVSAVAQYRGQAAALLVDTASQVTFISTPAGAPDTADFDDVTIGCETIRAYGRAISAAEESDLAGLPVVGFLGADYFQASPTRLDLDAARLTRIERAEIAATAVPLPYRDVFGYMFVDVTLDDVPLLLGFDTGAPHALWIGVDGEPGDVPVASVDGFGNPITFYLGSGTLSAGSLTREIPVLRILEHASIEASDEQLGIDADGLLGLSSLPGPSVVVDAERGTIWLE